MPSSMEPLAGKVVLICGAGAEAGQLAADLARLGAALAICDPDPARLGAVALPLNALPLPADPADPEECATVLAEVLDSLDRLDLIAGADGTGFADVARAQAIPCCALSVAAVTARLV